MAQKTDPNLYVAKPLAGGYDSRKPPNAVANDESPDLLNVSMRDDAVSRRGGFVPFVMEQFRCSAVKNQGAAYEAALGYTTTVGDVVPFRTVDGWATIPHRDIYSDCKEDFSVDVVFTVDALPTQTGGNAVTSGGGGGSGDAGGAANQPWNTPSTSEGYAIKVIPIVSKGPVKRSEHDHGTDRGSDTWTAQSFGTATDAGMPFCIYLYNNGTVSAPDWQLRCSFHELVAGNWNLRTITITAANLPIVAGRTYHVFFQAFTTSTVARLRASPLFPDEDPAYVEASFTLTGDLSANQCPIILFDCPQYFVQNDVAASATVRPGLGLNTATDGGIWYARSRLEGTIEELSYFRDGSLTLDRTANTKIDPVAYGSLLIGYWPMRGGTAKEVILDESGADNHGYFAPSGPIFSPGHSAYPGGGWWFNGITSYAQCYIPDDNPNWKILAGSLQAWFENCVLQNRKWGLEVTVWPHSIEPNFESVLMEIHGVLRVSIGKDGKIRVRLRNNAAVGTGGNFTAPAYQTAITSNMVLQCGRRYVIGVVKLDATTLRIYVNGVVDSDTVVLGASATGHHPGSITWGFGSYTIPVLQNDTPAERSNPPHRCDIDSRSGFVGVIESAKLLAGAVGEDDEYLPQLYKNEGNDDYRIKEFKHWTLVPNTPQNVQPDDGSGSGSGNVAESGLDDGRPFQPLTHQRNTFNAIYGIDGSATPNANLYRLHAQLMGLADGGNEGASGGFNPGSRAAHIYFVAEHWTFNTDDPDTYPGQYIANFEVYDDWNGTGSARTVASDRLIFTHVRTSSAPFKLNAIGGVWRCCRQHDVMFENPVATFVPTWADEINRHKFPRIAFRSPRELQPGWDNGMCFPLTGLPAVAMLADYESQQHDEKMLIAAVERGLFWVRPIWRLGSPFPNESQVSSPSILGRVGGHIHAESSNGAGQSWAPTTLVTWEAWIKPDALDGYRLLAFKGDPITGQCNYAIFAINGAIHVAGTMGGGTSAWRKTDTVFPSVATAPMAPLKLNHWNHVHLQIGFDGSAIDVYLHVNGLLIPLTDAADVMTTAAPDGTDDTLHIGDLPDGRRTVLFPAASPFTLSFDSFSGMISEVRSRNAHNLSFPINSNGIVPRERYSDDVNTGYLFHLDEGEGWGVQNDASLMGGGISLDNGAFHIRELHRIGSMDADTTEQRMSSVVYRDKLYLTNGLQDPLEVIFRGISDPLGMFSVHRLGIEPPVVYDPYSDVYGANPTAISVVRPVVLTGGALDDALYLIWVSFVDRDGRESAPTVYAEITTSTTDNLLGFRLLNLPRSPHPNVVWRRVYVSAEGGGIPILAKTVLDNETTEVDVPLGSGGASRSAVLSGVAPRGKFLTTSQGSLMIAHLTGIDAGENGVAWSQAEDPIYWAATDIALLDSENGTPITGHRANLGRNYIHKRDQVWYLTLSDAGGAFLSVVNSSIGLGSGLATIGNMVIGTGERGVFQFEGVNVGYISQVLEGDWALTDISNEGLDRISGLFNFEDTEYWLSIRRTGETWPDTIYVMHLEPSGKKLWSKYQTHPHACTALFSDPVRRRPYILLGTVDGQILAYDRTSTIDGANALNDGLGVPTLSGAATSTTVRTLTVSAPLRFTTLGRGSGLRGARVLIRWDGNSAGTERVIESNTATTLRWKDSLTIGANPTFEIGGYESYWTSGWISNGHMGDNLLVRNLAMEFAEAGNDVEVLVQAARKDAAGNALPFPRVFPDTNAETKTVPTSPGYIHDLGLHKRGRGRYVRLKVRQRAPQASFAVLGFALRFEPIMD